MIAINLTKPETTLDQVRKTYPKLQPTDAALISIALVLSGRHALAHYDDQKYRWTEDYEKLTGALLGQLEQIQQAVEGSGGKKTKASALVEEEAVEVKISLIPNLAQGEIVLGDRGDLKTLLADILQGGVEFIYTPTDIGWQWALDRVNWATLSGGELARRVKLKATFGDGALGTEVGGVAPKKRTTKKAPAEQKEPAEESE